jgi:anti-sigma B factor antagonist
MGEPLLTYTLDQRGEDVRLTLAGELDSSVVDQLQAALGEALALDSRTLTVDVSGVWFIDTSSIGLLVRTCNSARAEGRRFTVVDSRGLVRQVLQMMGLLDHLVQQPATPDGTAGAENS